MNQINLYKLILLFLCIVLINSLSWSQNHENKKYCISNNEIYSQKSPLINNDRMQCYQFINIDFDKINNSNIHDTLVLNCFEDNLFIEIKEISKKAINQFIIKGEILNSELSDLNIATFSLYGNILVADLLFSNGRIYEIRYNGKGAHYIYEVNNGLFKQEKDDFILDQFSNHETQREALQDDGSEIDILIAYTPEARVSMGGDSAMIALIDLLIFETNTMFQNSLVNTRLNLVFTWEVDYIESGDSWTELTRLRSTNDGYMDTIHYLRDLYCADLVNLIYTSTTSLGGYAYINSLTSSPTTGFSVNYHSVRFFSHEVGHNFGCHHPRNVTSAPGAFNYSHGYSNEFDNNVWTIMTYNGLGTTYFSNPNIIVDGFPIGVDSTDFENSADNSSTINNMSYYISNFRTSCSTNSSSLIKNSNNIFVYPNPVRNCITIKSSYINIPYKIEILSIEGRLIKEVLNNDKEKTIDISDLKNGLYLLKIMTSDKTIIKRLIKQ